MRSINLIATVAATATFGLAATAQADTYCVGSPTGCDGITKTDLKAGLEAADGHPGHDVVRLGSGAFTTPDGFAYNGGGTNTLELVGEGDATVLSADTVMKAGNFKVLTVEAGAPSRIAKLRIVTPSAPDNSALPLGLSLEGDVLVESVTVTDHGNEQQSSRGRAIVMDGGDLRDVDVEMVDTASTIFFTGSVSIFDTRVRGDRGIRGDQGSAVIRRTRVDAGELGVSMRAGMLDIESSVVRVDEEGGVALRASENGSTGSTVEASHVTLVGASAPDSRGVEAITENDPDVLVNIDNSILHGFDHGMARVSKDIDGAGAANIQVKYTNYNFANDYSEGAGNTIPEAVSYQSIGFVDYTGGDFRLKPGSKLIDKGRTGSFVILSDEDLAKKQRSVGAQRDLGAYEYQASAPVAVISGPLTGTPGRPLALSAAQSHDADGGDAVATWVWSFGDGAAPSETTRDVTHAWSQPGTYAVTLTVTDTTGKSTTTTKNVVIANPAQQPGTTETGMHGDPIVEPGTGTATTTATGTGIDKIAPALSGLRLDRAKGRLRFRLGEAAAVRVRIQRRSGRKFRAASKTKRFAAKAGANRVKVATKRLRPARYRLVVTATDAAGNRSVKRLAFRVR